VDDELQRAEGRVDTIAVKDQLGDRPGSRYIDFLIPGLLGFNLMSSGLWGVGSCWWRCVRKRSNA